VCCADARLVGFMVRVFDQLFYVADVSNDLCSGSEGPGTKHQAWRVASGDGDYRRSRSHAANGFHLGEDAQSGASVWGPLGGVPGYRALFVLGIARAKCDSYCDLSHSDWFT